MMRDTVRDLSARWRNAPAIEIVASHRDLPVAAPEDAVGLFLPGRGVWVVDQPYSPPHEVLAHEVIAHHGVRALLGKADWRMTMADVLHGINGGKDVVLTSAAMRIRAVYVDRAGELTLTSFGVADEVLARLAELWACPSTAMVEQPTGVARFRAYFADFRRRWLYQDVPADMTQMRLLLADASDFVLRGRRAWHPLAWWYPAVMPESSKPMGPNRPARSLRESERMLAAVHQRRGLVITLQITALLLLGLASAGLLVYEAWRLLIAPFFH